MQIIFLNRFHVRSPVLSRSSKDCYSVVFFKMNYQLGTTKKRLDHRSILTENILKSKFSEIYNKSQNNEWYFIYFENNKTKSKKM